MADRSGAPTVLKVIAAVRPRRRVHVVGSPRIVDPRTGGGGAPRPPGGVPPERIPTPIIHPGNRPPLPIVNEPVWPRWRSLRVVAILLGFFLSRLTARLLRRQDQLAAARRLREIFEEFGGLWVKLGQLLSLRTDVLPEPYCDELSKLQHKATGFSPALSVATIEAELGHPLRHFFREFDPHPFAAASISQVHRARLRESGLEVVVKVRRPNAPQSFERDYRLLRQAVRAFGLIRGFRYLHLGQALAELRQMMIEELDYRYEASNLRRMRKSLAQHRIHVPRVYLRLSTAAVITMEHVPGVLMSDYIEVHRRNPDYAARWCCDNNINPKKVGQRLVITNMRQLMEDNFFHGDMHPGNIMLLRDGRIALLDFGTVGRIEREFLEIYLQAMRALSENNFSKLADYMMRLCTEPPSSGVADLRADLIRGYQEWERRTHLAGLPYHEKAMTSAGTMVGRIFAHYGAQPSWTFLRISRTMATLDASLQYLIPDADYVRLFKRYFREAQARQLTPRVIGGRIANAVASLGEYDLLMKPLLRVESLRLQGTISKLSRVGVLMTRFMRFVLVLSFLGGAGALVIQVLRLNGMSRSVHRDLLRDLYDLELLAPDFPPYVWVALLAAVFYALRLTRRAQSVLQRRDLRSLG